MKKCKTPPSYKNQPVDLRKKAVEIANKLLKHQLFYPFHLSSKTTFMGQSAARIRSLYPILPEKSVQSKIRFSKKRVSCERYQDPGLI
jgi:hypothetical protein